MTLAYSWSELDKTHRFFLYAENHHEYHYWVWFYLSLNLNDGNYTLYPYKASFCNHRILKTYKEYDAETEAKRIANRINKIIK